MKLVHEFKEGSWGGSLHRITAVFEEGTRIEVIGQVTTRPRS